MPSAIVRDRSAGHVDALQAELTECEKALRRLTAAIASGGDLPTLVAALETQERRRTELRARLETAQMPTPDLDATAVRAQLENYLVDWRGLLRGPVYQAQQILRRLIVGRLTMAPQQVGAFGKRAYYAFSGVGTVRPLVAGTGEHGVPNAWQLEPHRRLAEADRRGSTGRLSPCRSWSKAVQ